MARDLAQEVTNRIVEAIENDGVLPWEKPWVAAQPHGGMPYNYASGKVYRGINLLMLYGAPFPSNAWLTFNQAKALGGSVRKGEKGTRIYFYKQLTVKDRDGDSDEDTKNIPFLREFVVFNVAQIEGLEGVEAPAVIESDNFPLARELLSQADIVNGGDRAYYHSGDDQIRMPQLGQFKDGEQGYYATALHELTHWTGHRSRCARQFGKRFGDQAYAFEELVAEIGSAILCAHVGIPYLTQHASYVASWLKVLKADKRAIFTAASQSQKAVDFIMNKGKAATFEDEAVAA